MVYRRIRIKDWTIRFLFSFDRYNKAQVLESLFWVDAPNSIVSKVSKNIEAGRLNEGFCYSDPTLRRTVFATGKAENGPEVLDSIVHEIFHIVQHIAIEDGIDIYSEDAAYLAGDISREISDIVCELSCPHCSRKV